jgi:hypothetical protein
VGSNLPLLVLCGLLLAGAMLLELALGLAVLLALLLFLGVGSIAGKHSQRNLHRRQYTAACRIP